MEAEQRDGLDQCGNNGDGDSDWILVHFEGMASRICQWIGLGGVTQRGQLQIIPKVEPE